MIDADLRGLRVALLGSIAFPTPPPGYGPWEQIASNLAEGMSARGLDVTLFATGNSRTRARLAAVVPVGLSRGSRAKRRSRERAARREPVRARRRIRPDPQQLRLEAADLRAGRCEAAAANDRPRLFQPADSRRLLRRRPGAASTARSATPIAIRGSTTWRRPTTASIRTSSRSSTAPGDYLVFLGRFHPEEGTHLAIEIARRAGVRLKIAGDPARRRVLPHAGRAARRRRSRCSFSARSNARRATSCLAARWRSCTW